MEGVSAGRGSGRRTLNWLEVHEAFGFERRDSVEICAPLPVSMAAFYASNFKLFATCWQHSGTSSQIWNLRETHRGPGARSRPSSGTPGRSTPAIADPAAGWLGRQLFAVWIAHLERNAFGRGYVCEGLGEY